MQIIFTISDDKVDEFKNAFLRIYPIPSIADESEEDELATEESIANKNVEDEWIKKCIKKMIFSVYEQGHEQIIREQNKPIYDEDIIEM